jgi:ABC-type phosphate/phosphonate transport system substrate-binding protein
VTRVASLGMYDLPWLAAATDALWASLRDELRRAGLGDVPDTLDRSRPLREIWQDPSLLLAQTCGYPLVTELAGTVRLVATPRYDLPGCAGARHGSVVVVREDEPAASLAAMRGRRCAINGRDSNTGMNLLRALVAPLAGGRPFFAAVVETGGHLGSLDAVRAGRADLAAIDRVTFGLAARGAPERIAGLRALAETPATPGLPFITAAATTDAERGALRAALAAVSRRPEAAALAWSGLEILGADAYEPVLALEREAAALGYPVLA